MSAIWGIINKSAKPIEQQDIDKLKSVIAHRATDGDGIWKGDNIALGFSKLVVYPGQVNERLPVESGDLVLTADARIDNRDQLCALLKLDKLEWANKPDSYVILKAFQHWGENCIHYMEGEYIFVVWNKTFQKLFAATDHIGFRSFFYNDSADQFIFCSEIKGVLAVKKSPNYFNEEQLIEYHFRQSDPTQTYNVDVFALCGGNTLVLHNNTLQIRKYWTLQNQGKYGFKSDDEWIACFRDLLYKSVEKRLNPDVPVGITLSGGLDSTSVACILSALLAKKNKPLYAFSSVLPLNHNGIEQDERKYIDVVNKYCPNIIQTFVEAPGKGPFTNVGDAFEKDEKIPNPFFYMDQAILEAAREKNIRSLFTGFGGDFWVSWAGNTVIYQLISKGKFKTALYLIKKFSSNFEKSLLQTTKTEYAALTKPWKQARKLIKPNAINWDIQTTLQKEFTNRYFQQLDFSDTIDNNEFMRRYVNKGSMGRIAAMFNNRNAYYNMTSNDPLFDKNLMEFLCEVPIHLFVKNGHYRSLIKHAMNGVIPPEIQWRRDKQPYNPDYSNRTMYSKELLSKIISSEQHKFIFENYISKAVILDHFEDIRPFSGMSGNTAVTAIRIMQGGISALALIYLIENNYKFGVLKT